LKNGSVGFDVDFGGVISYGNNQLIIISVVNVVVVFFFFFLVRENHFLCCLCVLFVVISLGMLCLSAYNIRVFIQTVHGFLINV
jgi:hypothetical protein